MTKWTSAAIRRIIIVAAGVVAAGGCIGSVPRMLSRPVTVQVGGLDCAGATLIELGYTITDGDRATGFIRGERQRPGGRIFDRGRRTDILMVSETTAVWSGPRLSVTASRWKPESTQVKVDGNGRYVIESGYETGPSDEGLADAEQLVARCAGASGEAS